MALERTYNFEAGTPAVADEVDTEFNTIVDFINDEVVQRDASVPFTSVPSGPSTDPTTDNHLTRKAYVDGKAGGLIVNKMVTSGGNLGVGLASGDYTNAIGSLTYTLTEENGHNYEAVLTVPEVYLDVGTTSFGVPPRFSAHMYRAGTEIARGVFEHSVAEDGVYVHLAAIRTATSNTTAEYTIKFRNLFPTGTVKLGVDCGSGWPMRFRIVDLGA